MLAVWGNGASQEELSNAKRLGAVSWRTCMNSPTALLSHSPCISKATNVGGKNVADEMSNSKFLNPDPWTWLIGRANEENIVVNGKAVAALLDTGSQVTHISLDYCQAMGINGYSMTCIFCLDLVASCGSYYCFYTSDTGLDL